MQLRTNLWVRKSPGEGNGNPLQYSCLENPMDRGAWWATGQGITKSQTWPSDWTHTHILCVVSAFYGPLPLSVGRACACHEVSASWFSYLWADWVLKSGIVLGGPNRVGGAFRRWAVRAMLSCWLQGRKQWPCCELLRRGAASGLPASGIQPQETEFCQHLNDPGRAPELL